jgi:hypothetical protein
MNVIVVVFEFRLSLADRTQIVRTSGRPDVEGIITGLGDIASAGTEELS